MQNLPKFFRDHGLNPEADERSVKRVYARQLKLIDPEADLLGFQELRECYEEAIAWLQHNADSKLEKKSLTSEVTTVSDSTNPAHEKQNSSTWPMPHLADPEEVARRMFEEMLKDMRAHVGVSAYAGMRFFQTLEDERMISMETRLVFEKNIAQYLLQGWQPGNGELFDVATEHFGWKKDRRRLMSWGQVGYVLERALLEQEEFYKKSRTVRERQWDILKKARAVKMPDHHYLKAHFTLMQRMVELYPTWVIMVSSKENIEHWYRTVEAMQEEAVRAREAQDAAGDSLAANATGGGKYMFAFFAFLIVIALFSGNSKNTRAPASSNDQDRSYVLDEVLPADILFKIGDEYFSGHGGKSIDANEAFRYWKLASDKGSANASYHLAWMTDLGNGVKSDPVQAYKWYEIAAEQGDIRSQNMMGDHYFFGKDSTKDLPKAFRFYQMAALQGNAPAQVQLAFMYDKGLGVEKQPEKVLALIQSAANSKNAVAEANLGSFYLQGQYELPKDVENAVYWLNRSANQGNAMGQRLLASVYERGLGKYPINLEDARKWYANATKNRDKDARNSLIKLCNKARSTYCQAIQ